MRKPEIINYNGHNIVYLDFSNMKIKDEIMKLEADGAKMIRSFPKASVLTLTNMENMFFNNEIRSYFSEIVKGNTPYVKASAVIGLTGLIGIMYNSFVAITGRNIKSFKTKEDALNYLIKQAS